MEKREEVETGHSGAGRARHPARPRRTTAWQEWLETVEGWMPAPPTAVGRDDVRIMGQPRPLRAEERIYVEPPGAPEIARRPLDLNAGQRNVAQNERIVMRPCTYAETRQFMKINTGLQLRPEYHTGWEYKRNPIWPN